MGLDLVCTNDWQGRLLLTRTVQFTTAHSTVQFTTAHSFVVAKHMISHRTCACNVQVYSMRCSQERRFIITELDNGLPLWLTLSMYACIIQRPPADHGMGK